MSNVGVANTKCGEYGFFSISFVAGWPLTYGILYTVELVQLFDHPKVLLFLEYKFINEWF